MGFCVLLQLQMRAFLFHHYLVGLYVPHGLFLVSWNVYDALTTTISKLWPVAVLPNNLIFIAPNLHRASCQAVCCIHCMSPQKALCPGGSGARLCKRSGAMNDSHMLCIGQGYHRAQPICWSTWPPKFYLTKFVLRKCPYKGIPLVLLSLLQLCLASVPAG